MLVQADKRDTRRDRRRLYVSGELVEIWENPDQPFGFGLREIQGYARSGSWELLFNAMVLAATLEMTSDEPVG